MSGPKGARGAQGPPVSTNKRLSFVNVDHETQFLFFMNFIGCHRFPWICW